MYNYCTNLTINIEVSNLILRGFHFTPGLPLSHLKSVSRGEVSKKPFQDVGVGGSAQILGIGGWGTSPLATLFNTYVLKYVKSV